ncbi:hypothetical protein IV203_015695 [Nitzschia inconspicua]|uniref:Uncharacterized protein n=1 Tax=Nitzschia inconspicua TaxID=303405 RepID=A0A9K3LD70_9STRA|nr:hypothetical protein IV203_015695 [Nitzschia inconspicua]
MLMSTFTFDQTFQVLLGISGGLIVLASFWIVSILIQIEKTKASAFSSVVDEDSENGGGDLHFEESTTGHIEMTDRPHHHLEVENPDRTTTTSPKGIGSAPTSPTSLSPRRRHYPKLNGSPQKTTVEPGRRKRRVPWSFVLMQIASVGALVLLTYLLLVVSNAPIELRGIGSFIVFFIFLRFQIGEELRRQRIDRIALLVSLFLVIASMLSLSVYSFKTLKQGEVYEGPARIVGYDMSNYNNTEHDPTTRTDIAVSWGKDWGCPLSGGKVCQSQIQGAMCQVHPDESKIKHKEGPQRKLEDDLEQDLEEEEQSNQELESENSNLEKENAELKKEIEELKQENSVEEQEVEEVEEETTSEIYEVEDEYDEEIMDMESEELGLEQELEDTQFEEEEKATTDPDEKSELQKDQNLVDEEYQAEEQEYQEYAEDYEEYADEDYSDAVEAEEELEGLESQQEEIEKEVEETESEIDEETNNNSDHGTPIPSSPPQSEKEAPEEEIIEESVNDDNAVDDEWYWDELPSSYDDDWFEDEYWDYDWDSVWGEYACEDLFDSDVGMRTFDPNTPAGGDDDWPFVNIYGSCKTCEAYVLDYFAKEAFEELEEYKEQAIIYMSGAIAGLIVSFVSYVKYRVMPTAENEIELLGSDGGVLA